MTQEIDISALGPQIVPVDLFGPDPAAQREKFLRRLCGVLAVVFLAVLFWPTARDGTQGSLAVTPQGLETATDGASAIPISDLQALDSSTPHATPTNKTPNPAATPSADPPVASAPASPAPKPDSVGPPPAPKSSDDTDVLNLYTPAPSRPPMTSNPPGLLEPTSLPGGTGESITVEVTILPRNVNSKLALVNSLNTYTQKGSGSFQLSGVAVGDYGLTIEASGYKTVTKRITLSDMHHNIPVVLEPLGSSPPVIPVSALTPGNSTAPIVRRPPPRAPKPTPTGPYEIPAPAF